MTSWPTRIEIAARKLAAPSAGRAEETVEKYIIHGSIGSPGELSEWLAFRHDTPNGFSFEIRDEFDQAIAVIDDEIDYPLVIRVQIEKPTGLTAYFFSAVGFARGIDDLSLPTYTEIRIAEEFSEFSSWLCVIRKWEQSEAVDVRSDVGVRVDARRLVRDATGNVVPASIEFWLLQRRPEAASGIFEIWRTQATKVLLPVLSAEIWPTDGEPDVILSGSRKRKLKLGVAPANASAVFDDVNDALTWVCESPREAEIRHTLLIKRLATEWPSSDPSLSSGLVGTLKNALDGARADYKAHLLQSTSDTLKALSDLRKALNDEVNKVVERTQSLSGAMFRDLAVALGAVAVRLVGIADGKSTPVATAFLGVVAVWLVTSLCISLRFNREALRTQAKARASWHRRVHGALAKRDFDLLARRPLKAAIKSYQRSAEMVSATYIAVAIVLGAWFVIELGSIL